jgi:aspartate/methionine/tyrosine aminotransferase
LTEKLKSDNNLDVGEENILITAGATNALSAAVQSVLDNNEDILVLTPCWPIFPGIIHSAGANIIEVPFYTLLYDNANLDIGDHLEKYLTKKSVAVYINSPNNPSGKVLNRQQLSQLAQFAREHDLWVISDEAYDGLLFDGHEHFSIASMPEMFPQTVSVFTFSKIFMFAGLRLGYAVGSERVITNLNKIMVHQLYSPSTITQQMMIEPVKNRYRWMKNVQSHYQELRDRFVERINLKLIKPEATYFLFFSIEKYLRGRDYNKVIDDCFKNGVSVAPGEDFGKDFSQYIRLCFTGEPPERLEKGIDRLLDVLL